MTVVGVCFPAVCQAQTLKLAWNPNPETNIASYAIYVSTSSGGYTVPLQLVPAAQTTFEFGPATPGIRYYFVVTAINTQGLQSTFSNEVSGVVTGFTNDPLVPGIYVRAIHISELRDRIDKLRSREGLPTGSWTGSNPPTGALIRAAHISEMRSKLDEVYQRRNRARPTYTDQSLAAGTLIKAAHISELRAAVLALE
jgi:hypothetical protein